MNVLSLPCCRFGCFILVGTVVAACGDSEPVEVPIDTIPLGFAGGQCVDRLKTATPTATVCLYFDDGPCVLVADLAAISSEGCDSDGICQISRDAWMKFCPPGGSEFDLETEAGQSLGAALFVLQSEAGGARPAFCSFDRPTGGCNASLREGQGDGGCLARLDLGYEVQGDGALLPNAQTQLSASGFFLDELGIGLQERLCPTVGVEVCPPESDSCTPVELDLRLTGVGAGDVLVQPNNRRCVAPGCTERAPKGTRFDLFFSAELDAVVASLSSVLGADGSCEERFAEPTGTASCSVALQGSGQVTATFGFPLAVVVAGEGRVTATPGGLGGAPIDCFSNALCRDVYDQATDVTLRAEEIAAGWHFTQWDGGPCDGSGSPTCTVRTDQAHQITARFGFVLELAVRGGGSITANPPGFLCSAAAQPCVVTYASGAKIILISTPGPDSVFAGWGQDCAGAGIGTQCTLTMDDERFASAAFAYEVRHRATGGGVVTRSPGGRACDPEPFEVCGAFLPDEVVTFLGFPDPDWSFLEWQGCGVGALTPSCALTVGEAADVVGVFGRPLDLTVGGAGTVGLSPAGTRGCGASTRTNCSDVFVDGVTVRFEANEDLDWALDTVSGCSIVPGQPDSCEVVMNQGRAVDIRFGRALQVNVAGSGRVTSLPSEIDCGAFCRGVFSDGSVVRLEAVAADSSWVFLSWSGCTPVAGSNPPACDVTMDGPRTVDVEFGRLIEVNVLGNGSVVSAPGGIACSTQSTGDCSEVFSAGTSVVLTARPDPGWALLSWAGCTPDPSFPQQCQVTADQARSVTVTFGRQMIVYTNGQGAVTTVAPSSGINCGADCEEVFEDGSTVRLDATADLGWVLVGFNGCTPETTNRCSVLMDRARTVEVTFGHGLTVSVAGGGQVTSVPGGINCLTGNTGDCSEPFARDRVVTLDANPDPGWVFGSWAGCVPVAGTPTRCEVTMSQAQSVTATFLRLLTASIVGSGRVTSTPPGINCQTGNTGDCTEAYADGTVVTLDAVVDGGSTFDGWVGCTPVVGNPLQCTVTMDQARSVTAEFIQEFSLTVSLVGGGSVSSSPPGIDCGDGNVDCDEDYIGGTLITLDAIPQSGWAFDRWVGCTPGSNPSQCTITINQVTAVTASFSRRLTVNVSGDGTVTSDPVGIDCRRNNAGDCAELYDDGVTVTLTATPNSSDWVFDSWQGNCTPVPGQPEQCTVPMTAAQDVTARFQSIDVLTITLIGSGTGMVLLSLASREGTTQCSADCSVTYLEGSTVTLSPEAGQGSVFEEFQGDCSGTACTVVMTQNRAVQAAFE